ncbi:MAG: hypothetical protein HQM00_08355 [Magnetococcales bacterium]|nr:hypothetical protein [Magnetococcales bacterium]
MRLALTNGNLTDPESWTLIKKIRPSAFLPSLPFRARLLERLNALIAAPVQPATETLSTLPASRRPTQTTLAGRFTRWMEKALIGALFSFWMLALWVVFDALRLIFF